MTLLLLFALLGQAELKDTVLTCPENQIKVRLEATNAGYDISGIKASLAKETHAKKKKSIKKLTDSQKWNVHYYRTKR